MLYAGVDVGKSKCRAPMMNAEGKIMKEIDFTNNSQGISSLTSLLSLDDHVVMESTGPLLAGPIQSFRRSGYSCGVGEPVEN